MKFTLAYPMSTVIDQELLAGPGLARFAQAAERAGYSAIAFAEHPAPSRKWLEHGGHQNLDPVAAMAFCAGVTQRIELMSYLLVLPYKNPFVSAKGLATVDLLSSGRVIAVCGAGYLRSEFRALGVDFDERNELFDEALEVIRGVWSQPTFDYTGRHFTAAGVAALPLPSRPGGPPLWIGGNSGVARRRAARYDGWSPIMMDETVSRTSRTTVLADIPQLARAIRQVRESAVQERGEGATVAVQVQTPQSRMLRGDQRISIDEHRDHLGRLAEAGVDRVVVVPPEGPLDEVLERISFYAETFIGVR